MKNLKYVLSVFAGGALYGTMSSFVKLANSEGFKFAEIAFFQAFFAAAILWALCFFKIRKMRISLGGILAALFSGCAIGMVNLLYYRSLGYISASLAVVVLMQFTWFAIVIEFAAFGKIPSKAECIAVLFLLGGTFLASGVLSESGGFAPLKGIAISLAGTLCYAVYVVINGHADKTCSWLLRSALIMSGSAAAIFLAAFGDVVENSSFGASFLPWGIGFAVFGTAIPTSLFAIGIPKTGICLSSILMTVELPVAVLCAHFILGENIGAFQTMGIFIMFSAIALINYCGGKSLTSRLRRKN